MLDTIVRRATQKASIEPQKAVAGPGASVMMWGTSIADATRDEGRVLRDALTVYRTNRWINRAEGVISSRVAGAAWHLEDANGDEVTDESNPALKAVRDVFEKPLLDNEMAAAYPSQPATWRNLSGLTSRHMGLCNVGFWHLDELDRAMGFPRRIFYIRPDRLTPDISSGGRLLGWKLDASAQGGGTALSLEEVLPFYLDQPDKGYYGVGLPESIWATLPLPSAVDGHALDTLASGGRLPGIYSPKESAADSLFDRLSNDLRTIKEMPDAAKRDVVARMPMEFTPTAADMASLNVILLSQMSRDDTLTHWGVPLSTIGGTGVGGLNSGEQRKYDEAALWQNAVQFRVDALRETIQMRLLDRLQATGIYLQLVIETPAFDDDAPRYTTAASAMSLPLTDNERRALVGLDPLPGTMGNVVRLPINIQEVASVVEDTATTVDAAKAKISVRPQIDRLLPKMKRDLNEFFAEQKKDIASKVQAKAAHLAKNPSDQSVWWSDEWDKKLERVLRPYASVIADMTAEQVSAHLKPAKADFGDLVGNNVLQRLLKSLGTRIKGINETTRQAVSDAIKEGVEAGDGAAELGDRIESVTAFDEYRSELIGRTESARVLNDSQIESYREYGVEKVVAIDGDDDEECAARDGQEFDLEDALAIEDHPNGTLDWAPVVGA